MIASLLTIIVSNLILLSFFLVVIFWLLRTARAVSFYLYLWQLKEYRIERFLDHFHTAQGKRLLLNKIFFVKILILVFFGISLRILTTNQTFPDLIMSFLLAAAAIPFFALTALYAMEALRIGVSKKPVFTNKVKFLFGLFFLGELLAVFFVHQLSNFVYFATRGDLFLSFFVYPIGLLTVDLLVPFIVSIVVLALQPFTVLVRNRRLAAAKAKRETFKKLKAVGITGSYGKTSTKEFLAYILSKRYKVLKTPEHQNSEFGVANTILNKLGAEHEVFVCEMGAYKKGEIKALAEVAQPHIGIVTGVNEQHLATFGSMENLLSAEGGEELVEMLPENGAIVLNGNNEYCKKLYEKIEKPRKVLYNIFGAIAPNMLPEGRGLQAKNVRIEKERVLFEVEEVRFEAPVYGGHNVQNLLGAIGVARELGMSLQEIADAAKTMPLELSSLKVKKGGNGMTIIDSTYSANPDGVIADLDYLGLYEGKKVLIMPSLIELGSAAKDAHKRIGEKIAQVCDLAIITTKEHYQDIKEGAGGSEKVLYMENAQAIIQKIKGAGAILLEGGKESRLQRALVTLL